MRVIIESNRERKKERNARKQQKVEVKISIKLEKTEKKKKDIHVEEKGKREQTLCYLLLSRRFLQLISPAL